MIEVVRVCKNHGDLTINDVYEERYKSGLTFRLRCKACRLDYEARNKEARLAYSREYEKTKRKRPADHYEAEVRARAREWRRKNADTVNAKVAIDRKANPEKYREYDRNWRANNLEKARELDVIKKHKMSYDEYKWMCDLQAGKCAICNQPETRKSRTSGEICRLAIDHDHETGKIRKLLCHSCNTGIGKFRDRPDLLQAAIEYLKKHQE